MQNGDQTVATRIRAFRMRHGWSQNELFRRSGVHNSTISRIESGEIPSPGIDILSRLSNALGVDLSEITGEAPMPRRRVVITEGVARLPLRTLRVQADGHPSWDQGDKAQ